MSFNNLTVMCFLMVACFVSLARGQSPLLKEETSPADLIALKARLQINIWQHLASIANVSEFCVAQGLSASEILRTCLHPVCHSPSEVRSITHTSRYYAHDHKIWYKRYPSWGNFTNTLPADALILRTPHTSTYNTTCARLSGCTHKCVTPPGRALACTYTQDVPALPQYMSLPAGWFLSCNEETYNYFPKDLAGGTTCCISRLTVILPPREHFQTPSNPRHTRDLLQERSKRTTTLSELDMNCDSDIHLLSHPEILGLAFSILGVPGLSAGNAKTIGKLACLSVKNLNHTSTALSLLNQEQSILRRAMLENRAALDYLLIRAHLGCTSFKNICCFNLTDNSLAIHHQIKSLQDLVNQVQQRSGSLIDKAWETLTGWLPDITWIKHVFLWITVLICTTILLCCLVKVISCCCRMSRPSNTRANLFPVVENPHVVIPLLELSERMWGT